MKTERLSFKWKKRDHEVNVCVPEDLAEAVKILGREAILEALLEGLRVVSKREYLAQFKRKRKHLKITLESITPEQHSALKQVGLL